MKKISKFLNLKNHNQNLKSYFEGDIQKFSSKLQVLCGVDIQEKKHLLSYNYLGPGMRHHIKLSENNIPRSGEEPINAIDRLAYIHDLTYQNSGNIFFRSKHMHIILFSSFL